MDIKNFLYQREEKKAKNIWIFVIGIIVIWFIVSIIFLNKTNYVPPVEHFIWEKVSTFWIVSYDNNYPTNTHKLSNVLESFGLKDSAINLNNFLDTNVEIDWNISEITDKYPILLISKLKIPDYKLSISENKYFYVKDLISFDFSKDTDVYSKKTWWKIVIYYQKEPILYVDTFICNNIIDSQNCENMKKNYIMNLNETFQSTLWYTFFRNKENSWVTFNDNNIWYIFTANTDEDMLNLSHLIYIIDSNFLGVNKENLIISWCSNSDIILKNISSIEKGIIDDNLIRLSVTWKTTEWKIANCKLNIDIFDDWNIINSSISIDN